MIKKIFSAAAVSAVIIVLSAGCATSSEHPITIGEIMQQPEGTRYYLAHNIWTNGRHTISSINYQHGRVLPFGTEVKVISITPKKVRFKVMPDGPVYTIKYYEKYAMEPIEKYIRKLFTTKNREELLKGTNPEFRDDMLNGKVVPGMTRREVVLTYGPPSPHRTPSPLNPTWIYWTDRYPHDATSAVLFKGDKVLEVMPLNK